jgi:hypothetical protein
MSDSQRKYATAQHPTIEALIHGLYKYADRKQALSRFKNITGNFVLSKDQPESTADDPVVHFWIKGFGVTPEEETQGYTGHFCEMRLGVNDKGQHTLTATKVDKPIANHPQKKRLQSKHPNWGHPVMRAVKKGKLYDSLDAATSELELLHVEFPEVSIPGINKLYIILYEKREGIKQPTRKIALELEAREDKFIILCRDNEKGAAPPASKQPPSATDAGAAPVRPANVTGPLAKETPKQVGSFTAQELLRKKKRAMKRKKSDPRISKKIATNPHDE